jgi:EpsI family protein
LGQTSSTKIIILVLFFVLTGILLHWKPASNAAKKEKSLSQALANIPGWENITSNQLDAKIVQALELDEYVNHNFSNGEENISLYIGYYFTSKKVGAAHDPLVCFPGQGWTVSGFKKGDLTLNTLDNGSICSISYSEMIARLGQQKELILYWFQAYDQTNSNTFSQKISLLRGKTLGRGEDNAFVRITVRLGKKSLSEYRETLFKFIRAFYPVFLNYVKEGNSVTSAADNSKRHSVLSSLGSIKEGWEQKYI